MIRPEDIFNAHRVVGTPDRYRKSGPPVLPVLTGGGLVSLHRVALRPLTDAQRRSTALRVIQRTTAQRVTTARSRLSGLRLR